MFFLAFHSLLTIIKFLDLANIPIFPNVNRITTKKIFQINYDITLIIMIFFIFWMLWSIKVLKKKVLYPFIGVLFYPIIGFDLSFILMNMIAIITSLFFIENYRKYLDSIFYILIMFEGLVFVYWTICVPFNIKSPLQTLALFELDVFYLFSYLAPIILTLFLYGLIFKKIFYFGWKKSTNNVDSYEVKSDICSKNSHILLVFSIVISMVAGFYPYLSVINPDGGYVGVDLADYIERLDLIKDDIFQVFNQREGSTPLTYILIFIFKNMLNLNTEKAIMFFPVVVMPILVFSIYIFTLELFQNEHIAAWAAFFTASGYHVTVNMYSYFLSNVLGLSLVFISLTYFYRSIRLNNKIDLIISLIAGILLVFSHPWTYVHYFIIFVLTTIIKIFYIKKSKKYDMLYPNLVYILVLAGFDFIKINFLNGFGGIKATSTVMNSFINLNFWFNIIFTFQILFGGYLSNLLLLILAIIGMWYFTNDEENTLFLEILLLVSSLIFFIGDEVIKSRILYNLPIGIFASYGLNIFTYWNDARNLVDIKLVKYFIYLNMLVYLFRSLVNLI